MHILVATDKFKGSLDSFAACKVIAQGLHKVLPEAHVVLCPLADGGDGWSSVIRYHTYASEQSIEVLDPLLRPVQATYTIAKDGTTAFLEMAQASGLWRLQNSEYNCTETSSFGTGQMLLHAAQHHPHRIVLGIGGSATNDCGMGMAAALGYRFLDMHGKDVVPKGKNLLAVAHIVPPQTYELKHIAIDVACDVVNLLTGATGATRMFAPQKGATEGQIEMMEAGMVHFAEVIRKDLGVDVLQIKGGGAAGGLGAGAVAFLGAELKSGTALIMEIAKLPAQVRQADLVITGEGKLDAQTLQGKLVAGVARLGAEMNKPVYALCGVLDLDVDLLHQSGIKHVQSLVKEDLPLDYCIHNAALLLEHHAAELARDWLINDEY